MSKTKIICEFASSWNGDPHLLKAMVKTAVECGADVCKLQDYRAEHIPDSDSDKARYEKYQVKDELYPKFIRWCNEFGVEPLTTCFNKDRAMVLAKLGFKKIKLASISLTNTELIKEVGLRFDEVIVSTGMHTKKEIEDAIDLLSTSCKQFTIMHCVANYPLTIEDVNLKQITWLKQITEYNEYVSVGYSDHSLDLDVAKAAIAMSVKYLEKHFTLSRYLPQIPHQMYKDGPLVTTHEVSIEPKELKELCGWNNKVALMNFGQSKASIAEEHLIKEKYLTRYGV